MLLVDRMQTKGFAFEADSLLHQFNMLQDGNNSGAVVPPQPTASTADEDDSEDTLPVS